MTDPPRLRVAFDATALLDAHPTGVGVFARTVLDGLAHRPDLAMEAFAVSWRGRSRLASATPAGVATTARPMAARPLRELWRRFDRPPIEWWTGPTDVV